MAITTITLNADRTNYSRYDDQFHVINATAITNAAALNDQVVFTLQRRAKGSPSGAPVWYIMATQMVTMAASQTVINLSFDLRTLFDSDGFYVGRHSLTENDWQIFALSDSVSAFASFSVLMITVEEMRNTWCFGLPLISIERLQAINQPQLITGVTVTGVPFNSAPGAGLLVYKPLTQQLQWKNGPLVTVTAGQTNYTLGDGGLSGGGLTVHVVFASLPAGPAPVSESIFITYGVMPDSTIIRRIIAATRRCEELMYTALEPRLILSRTTAERDNLPLPPAFDDIVDPIWYYKPFNVNQWLHIETPYPNTLKVKRLSGFMNQTKVVDIDQAWILPNGQNGKIDLVPSNAAILNWYLYGPGLYTIFFNYTSVPGFWNFILLCGLRECPEDVRKYIGIAAAIDLLTPLAMARYPAGVVAYSISRDGVSESRTLIPGIYLQYVTEYEREIGRDERGRDAMITSLREQYVGFISVSL